MTDEHRLALGVFMPNISGAYSLSTAPRTTRPTFEYNKRAGIYADELMLDFVLPATRYAGLGGRLDYQGWMLEPFTFCSALATVTRHVKLCCTVNCYMFHPITVAKLGAGIDHISNGRLGLNIVSGWVGREFEMFDREPLDEEHRAIFSREWITIVRRLWSEDVVDFEGEYFTVHNGYLEPKPIQAMPTILKAGQTQGGSVEFVAQFADWQFILGPPSVEVARETSQQLRETAAKYGRTPRVMTNVQVVIRDSEAEAQREVDRIMAEADWGAIDGFTSAPALPDMDRDSELMRQFEEQRSRMALGLGSMVAAGTPERVADVLEEYHDSGLDGMLLQFYDYEQDFHRFGDQVLPILEARGLRVPRELLEPGFERWSGREMVDRVTKPAAPVSGG